VKRREGCDRVTRVEGVKFGCLVHSCYPRSGGKDSEAEKDRESNGVWLGLGFTMQQQGGVQRALGV